MEIQAIQIRLLVVGIGIAEPQHLAVQEYKEYFSVLLIEHLFFSSFLCFCCLWWGVFVFIFVILHVVLEGRKNCCRMERERPYNRWQNLYMQFIDQNFSITACEALKRFSTYAAIPQELLKCVLTNTTLTFSVVTEAGNRRHTQILCGTSLLYYRL